MNDEEKEELEMKAEIQKLLYMTKEKVWKIFEDHEYDAAYFDIIIDLKVKINTTQMREYEKINRLEGI